MFSDDLFMHRCINLAEKGAGRTSPNPMVGAVLVHENKIIGEGWHKQYGEAHAEVNAVDDAIEKGNGHLVSQSTLYVSLEPCAHYGKTPPCTDLIIKHKISNVIIGCRDPYPGVNGRGIGNLEAAGVGVITGLLEKECSELNKRFFSFHTRQRPYVILKWAETADGFISSGLDAERLLITNKYTDRLVHKWRSEEDAILVGTNTALHDNPSLTTRLWPGRSPIRLVIDRELRLPYNLNLFNSDSSAIVFNEVRHSKELEGINISFLRNKPAVYYFQTEKDEDMVPQVLSALLRLKILSVIVEGGARLLQSFIDHGTWDEARRLVGHKVVGQTGRGLVTLKRNRKVSEQIVNSDRIEIYEHDALSS